MKTIALKIRVLFVGLIAILISMCVPPETAIDEDLAERARLDSLRELRCPRLMSSAAEYYRNQDWESTVRIYREVVDLRCDIYDSDLAPPKEIYLYYGIAYEQQGKFDSSEYVLLQGLEILPDNIELRKHLAYSYKKLGQIEKYSIELGRIMDLAPDDEQNMKDLADLYAKLERYVDQIYVLNKLLEVNPNNEIAQGNLAIAYVNIGRDPLDLIRKRYENNPENISYGLELAKQLMEADQPDEATNVLKRIIRTDPSNKIAHHKLAEAYDRANDLESTSQAYEELFKLDPRDFRVAIKISEVNIELEDFGKAFRWADKAIQISKKSGEAYGQKGNVYYKALNTCRTRDISVDDRIVATLAFNNFRVAKDNGFQRHNNSMNWLDENEVLFDAATWFMLDPEKKNSGYVKPESPCYKWVDEKLMKDPKW